MRRPTHRKAKTWSSPNSQVRSGALSPIEDRRRSTAGSPDISPPFAPPEVLELLELLSLGWDSIAAGRGRSASLSGSYWPSFDRSRVP